MIHGILMRWRSSRKCNKNIGKRHLQLLKARRGLQVEPELHLRPSEIFLMWFEPE